MNQGSGAERCCTERVGTLQVVAKKPAGQNLTQKVFHDSLKRDVV